MSKMSRRPDPVNIIQDFTTSTFEGYRDPMESFSYVSDIGTMENERCEDGP